MRKTTIIVLIVLLLPMFLQGQEKLKTKGIIPVMSWGAIAANLAGNFYWTIIRWNGNPFLIKTRKYYRHAISN